MASGFGVRVAGVESSFGGVIWLLQPPGDVPWLPNFWMFCAPPLLKSEQECCEPFLWLFQCAHCYLNRFSLAFARIATNTVLSVPFSTSLGGLFIEIHHTTTPWRVASQTLSYPRGLQYTGKGKSELEKLNLRLCLQHYSVMAESQPG